MKNLVTKLFAVIFIIMLAAGCASSITAPQEIQNEKQDTEIVTPDDITAGTDMEVNREKPGLPE